MGQPNCFGAIQAVATRVSKLSAVGAPSTGANNGYSTTVLMTADIKADVQKGNEEVVTNAKNDICQYFRDCDRLKSVNITMDVCSLEPDLCQLLANGLAIPSPGTGIYAAGQSGKSVGWQFPKPDDTCANGVCLEFWQLAWDNDTQATSTLFNASNTLTYIHWVFPRVTFQLADFKVSEKFTTFKFEGFAKVNPKITANGPFDDWDAAVANFGGITGLGGFFYDDNFPTTQCGLISVPSAAS